MDSAAWQTVILAALTVLGALASAYFTLQMARVKASADLARETAEQARQVSVSTLNTANKTLAETERIHVVVNSGATGAQKISDDLNAQVLALSTANATLTEIVRTTALQAATSAGIETGRQHTGATAAPAGAPQPVEVVNSEPVVVRVQQKPKA